VVTQAVSLRIRARRPLAQADQRDAGQCRRGGQHGASRPALPTNTTGRWPGRCACDRNSRCRRRAAVAAVAWIIQRAGQAGQRHMARRQEARAEAPTTAVLLHVQPKFTAGEQVGTFTSTGFGWCGVVPVTAYSPACGILQYSDVAGPFLGPALKFRPGFSSPVPALIRTGA